MDAKVEVFSKEAAIAKNQALNYFSYIWQNALSNVATANGPLK